MKNSKSASSINKGELGGTFDFKSYKKEEVYV